MAEPNILNSLHSRRNQIKNTINRAIDFANTFDISNQNINFVKARLEITREAYAKFETINDEILKHSTDLQAEANEQAEFEELYCTSIAIINSIIEQHSVKSNKSSTSNIQPTKQSKLNLPTINIPNFSGNYEHWLGFRDLYVSLIHDNADLSDTEKMHYLRSSLSAEALKTIESLAISNANYNSAWSLLQKRFENKRLIIQAHVRKILNTPIITKSNQTNLRQLIDDITLSLESLKTLKINIESWDPFLVPLIADKLDFNCGKDWQAKLTSEVPTLDQLLKFLESRTLYLESLNYTNNQKNPIMSNNLHFKQNSKSFNNNKFNVHASVNKRIQCSFCLKFNHILYQCTGFLKLSIENRIKFAKDSKLCANCLKPNHAAFECMSKNKCRDCNKRHNTLLHLQSTNEPQNEISPQPSTSSTSCYNADNNRNNIKEMLLSTAIVLIKDIKNNVHKCRALLDSGSQSNFISKNLVQKLGFKTRSVNHCIQGINQSTNFVKDMADLTFYSQYSTFNANINCFVLSKITNSLPTIPLSTSAINIPQHIKLADQNFFSPGPIDLLIGTELFLQLLTDGKFSLANNKIHMQNTHLGYIAGGTFTIQNTQFLSTCNLAINDHSVNPDNKLLSKQIERFWEIEGHVPAIINPLTKEQQNAEKQFVSKASRNNEGRFVVPLITKHNKINLGNSYAMAEKRFFNLERRFNKDPILKMQYTHFMQEYLRLGHMKLSSISIKDIRDSNNSEHYFIPHHPIFKDNKLRTVFDASAKSSNNLSLNDNLLTGPIIQNDLLPILLRFRLFKYVFSADLVKMYRQFLITPDHTKFQKILWRNNDNEPLNIYELLTVTYGTSCGSFLAVRCLHELAFQNQIPFNKESKIILRDMYVDDLLTGSNDLDELASLRDNLIIIFNSAGLELSKWASNSPNMIPGELENIESINLDKENDTKTLGLYWNCSEDILTFKIQPITATNSITKRQMLSTISKVYDPLGLVSPVIIKSKILMQKLWSLNIGWDEPVPSEVYKSWTELTNQLNDLKNIVITRKVIIDNPNYIEIHSFADASEKAYNAAIYLRSIDADGHIQVNLLIAKSRVAPLKVVSIPRLELLAAQLSAQLTQTVINSLNITINAVNYWTDSTIVLAWIAKEPSTWQTFVANRVSDIQNLTDIKNWKHVRSEDNPADILSRGTDPNFLINFDLWWHGPQWLSIVHDFPVFNVRQINENEIIPETKNTVSQTFISSFDENFMNRFSNFTQLKRFVALAQRFKHNCLNSNKKLTTNISTEELHRANKTIVKVVQNQAFLQEIRDLKRLNKVNKNSKLSSLNVFLDEDDIIRVGGRLKNASLNYDHKHPIVLPKNHYVTNLIINYFHIKNLHSGSEGTLASIRQSYWIISGRNAVKNILHKCVTCFKAKPIINQQIMGNLPADRVVPSRPFFNTGVDFCGPVRIKEGGRRSKKTVKSYICLFVCLCTKAVHIELVSDLTAECFLNSVRRLISRRGFVKHFRSDNAGNFTGANKELKELFAFFKSKEFNDDFIVNLNNQSINWTFAPPRSPNFSGLMEAAVKSTKYHLKRVIGDSLLTYEEMCTLLVRIEAILNSRPLIPLSGDPNDLSVLTPGHFLIGDTLTAPIEYDVQELRINHLSRWQLVERLRQHFWNRYRREFLTQLQGRTKWMSSKNPPVRIGDLVIISEDNIPPLNWPLGRVIDVHPGKDSIVRVVSVRTNKGLYKRAISRICVLPIESELPDN